MCIVGGTTQHCVCRRMLTYALYALKGRGRLCWIHVATWCCAGCVVGCARDGLCGSVVLCCRDVRIRSR